MKFPILFLLVLSVSFALAQSSSYYYIPPGTVTVKFCPLALADDISFPTIQMGIEYRVSKQISWYNEFGIKYRKSYYEKTDTSFISSKGFKAKTELRYYIKKRNRKAFGFYGGVNAFFTRDYHNNEILYFHDKDTAIITDAFAVRKDVFGFNFIFGFQRNISKKIGVDVYGGVGIRFRDVTAYEKEYNKKTDDLLDGPDIHIKDFRDRIDANNGFSTTGNLTFGVRFCYKL